MPINYGLEFVGVDEEGDMVWREPETGRVSWGTASSASMSFEVGIAVSPSLEDYERKIGKVHLANG